MADKEKYMIKIKGDLIEVSKDVYYAYFHMERQERTQNEKHQRNDVFSYDALDNGEIVGAESIVDIVTPSLEEQAIANDMHERLHHAIAALPRSERELIRAIYFEGKTEREYAMQLGCSQNKVFKRRVKILSKLKMFLDFMGSF